MPLFGEIFLSEILRKPVLDPTGEDLGRVRDILIVKGEPLPKVDSLIVERRKKNHRIPWPSLNIFNKKVISTMLNRSSLAEYPYSEEDLLVVRDLLDKQIVDVNGVKVVRVNDIKLEGYGVDAILVAVDVGMRGIMRRLGIERGGEDVLRLFRVRVPYNLISWNYIQPLQPKLSTIALTVPRRMVTEIHPADLAELISQVSHEEGSTFIEHLDAETAAEAISELEPDSQTAMIADMETEKATTILNEMSPDTAADILSGLSADKAKEILEGMDSEYAEDIQELLGHEEDSAGGLMTNEFIAYQPGLTVFEAIQNFHKDAPEIETVYYIYVTDEAERLVGVVSLKELLLAEQTLKLSEVMETRLKSVPPETDEMEVAETISKYNLVALPVVDEEGVLLGIVTIDDIVDRIVPPLAKRKRRKV